MIKRFWSLPIHKKVLWIFGGVALFAVVAFFFGFLVMILWNWLMPDIFNLPEITYWQAWGLVFMAHILFKSMGHHDHDKQHNRNGWKDKFKQRFKEEWKCHSEDDDVGEPVEDDPDKT